MDDKFIVGLALGMIGGALIVANSMKARQMVKNGQEEVMQKVKDMKNKTNKGNKQSDDKDFAVNED